MDKIVVKGGPRLKGRIKIGGAKNAVLPMMAACLLASGESVIRNVPLLADVITMKKVLEQLGAKVTLRGHTLRVDTSRISRFEAPYDLVRTMRASVYVLGPLLGSFGRAKVSLPGGCAWGPRPVDLHIRAMQELGAKIRIDHGYIVARASSLKGETIVFSIPSVGATANTMMAAARAKGRTIIINPAKEPEIVALAEFINRMGGRIRGAGTETIEIEGVAELGPAQMRVIPDRIETGTFMIAGAITAGEITLENCIPEHVEAIRQKLIQSGVVIEKSRSCLHIRGRRRIDSVDAVTAPYPGFPTDMQAQYMALMTIAKGTCVISETVFPDRFTHVPELRRLGASIKIEGNTAHVGYVRRLSGAPVMATDLRASAALVLAGLVADGETHISRVYHIDRGYEAIEEKLSALGADIKRMPE